MVCGIISVLFLHTTAAQILLHMPCLYLCAVPVQYKSLHIVRVALQLHVLLTRSRVPDPNDLLRGP